ncbi:MAG: PKD domain-containing protein [Methanoregula sp.]|nr:MAG: PKD domain-containing protein [Methanoregula sp.]
MSPKENVTSEQDAPEVATRVMEQYGGLPSDAVFSWSETNYLEHQTGTGEVISKKPVTTTVAFGRRVNGLSLDGDTDGIRIELGSDGEPLEIRKRWRTLTYTGNVSIIPATKAVEKLLRDETMKNDWRPANVSAFIDIIRLRYYQKGDGDTNLEPVWVFVGETKPGDYGIKFLVYARQFANFTASPTVGSYPLVVQFTDTSDASPIKWYWDFGDGSNSTLRNPLHTYQTGGNYTVNLMAWNDLGSDTISRADYITIYPNPAPVAGFTSNYTWENHMAPLAVAFNDTSTGIITNWSWDFGDGTNSTLQNPIHIFNETPGELYGDYTVTLNVTDDVSRLSAYSDYISVVKGLYPNFTAEPTRGPAPLNVTFTDLTQDYEKALGLYWDFGDDSYYWPEEYPSPRTIYHEYASDGVYNVTLTYYGTHEEPYWLTKEYYIIVGNVSPPPVADFTANVTSGKVPLAVAFTDTSTGSPTDWMWDFGDGTNTTDQNPAHVYSTQGTYAIKLAATNAVGSNSLTRTDYITVFPLTIPAANFTADPISGKVPLTVSFSDTSTGSPTSWYWDFGDGTNSTGQNPIHTYTSSGVFSVSLNATNTDGSDTKVLPDYITVIPLIPPAANFTANPVSGTVPLLVGFRDLSTNTPTSWYWDFGDGTNSTDKNPLHGFTTAGNFTILLKAANVDGNDTVIKPDYITVTSLSPPVANFTANVTSGKNPLTVAFTDTSANTPTQWLWDFGDGNSAPEQNPVHIYTTAGTFTISLKATNADGRNTITKTDYIIVLPRIPPDAGFTANATTGNAPLVIAFTDTSTNTPDGWVWNFGDGTTSTVQNPVHIYTTAGKYTVSLTAANADGSDTETRPDYIIVTSLVPPVAGFSANITSGKVPLAVSFSDLSTGSPTGWSWTFGDSAGSSDRNPVHVYSSAGIYTVSLHVTNADGSDTATKVNYISVSSPVLPVANFLVNTTSGNTPLAVAFTDTSSGSPTSWSWNFGDGVTATGRNLVHVYSAVGKFTVSLTVTNPDGSDTITKPDYITVTSPTPTPTPTPTPGTIPATIRIEPETLNLKSKGVFTAFITLPSGYNVNNIDVASLVCEGAHAKSGHATGGGEYIAKFERQDLVGIVPGDAVTFTVVGNVIVNGNPIEFRGSDTIRVIE